VGSSVLADRGKRIKFSPDFPERVTGVIFKT